MTARDGLPDAIEKLIREVLEAAALDRIGSRDVEQDLRDHFEDGLAAGLAIETLIERFGKPAAAGRRIANARPADPNRAWNHLRDELKDPRRRSSWAETAWTEMRLGLRSLRRAPGFAILVLATLALGIGANTAVFSVLDAVLLKPLPYDDAGQLVRIQETWEGQPRPYDFIRAPVAGALRSWDGVFNGVGTLYTYRETGADLTGGDRPERIVTSPVSAGFFEMLGATPVLGRTFNEDESFGPGEYGGRGVSAAVAVLSHGLWTRRFGTDRSILGRTIDLNGLPIQVVGVMGPDFVNPLGSAADLWVPQDLRPGGSNGWRNYYLTGVGRLPTGLTLETAQARADALAGQLRESEPDSGEWGVLLTPLQTDIVGTARRSMLWILAAAVALVLLSACVNVGNLVFARGLDREREVAVRGALGSGRRRLVGHLITENALLAFGGCVLGLALGVIGVRALMALAPDALPDLAAPGLSPGVFGFALAAMVASLLIFGLAPTLRLSRVSPAIALRAGGRSGTESGGLKRIRSGLVVAQVAVALVLVVGSGLLIRSFSELRHVALGVEPEQVLTFEVHLPTSRYIDGAARHAFHDQLQQRVAGLAGVLSVGATSWLPLNGRYHVWGTVRRLDDPEQEIDYNGSAADVRMIAGDYFAALGIQRFQGLSPREVDPDGEPVVWLSRSLADRIFPDRNPIGTLVRAANEERRVVGVVDDVALDARGSVAPTVYVPHAHYADNRNWALIQVVRARAELPGLGSAIEQELAGVDGDLVLYRSRPFTGFVDRARAQDRFALLLMTLFALLAITLASVGTYGILAGSVAKRTREIGIRMALGADAGWVRWSVVRSALAMIGGGIALGTFLAWAGTRWLSSMLFQVQPGDPVTFLGAVVVLGCMGILASVLPANRATKIDPARSLAEE